MKKSSWKHDYNILMLLSDHDLEAFRLISPIETIAQRASSPQLQRRTRLILLNSAEVFRGSPLGGGGRNPFGSCLRVGGKRPGNFLEVKGRTMKAGRG